MWVTFESPHYSVNYFSLSNLETGDSVSHPENPGVKWPAHVHFGATWDTAVGQREGHTRLVLLFYRTVLKAKRHFRDAVLIISTDPS